MSLKSILSYYLLFIFSSIGFAQQPKLVLPIGHTGGVLFAQFSPDAKKIVTVSGDKTAKIWDGVSGKLLANLKEHTSQVESAQWSADSKKIVTVAQEDKTARIWNAEEGTLLAELKGHTSFVDAAQFSPDGKKIITSAANDKTPRVWDAANGTLLFELKGHTSSITSAEFSPNGKKIVTSSKDGNAGIWNAENGILNYKLVRHKDVVNSAHFSPDSKKIITASNDATVVLWDAEKGIFLYELKHKSFVMDAQISPDGKKIVTRGYINRTARIWDAENETLIAELTGPDNINAAQFSPDSKMVVTISDMYKNVVIWDTETGTRLIKITDTDLVFSAQFSPDGKKIITASLDTKVKIWEVKTGMLLIELKGNISSIQSAQFSADGKKIITNNEDHYLKIWDADYITIQKVLKNKKASKMAEFSADGKKIVTTPYSGSAATLWDAEADTVLWYLSEFIESIKLSPDGKKYVVNKFRGEAEIRDLETDATLAELKGHTSTITSIHFSTDGNKIVTASSDNTAKIWDAGTGALLRDLKTDRKIYSAQFSPNGQKVITTSTYVASIWDANNGNLLIDLKGHTDVVHYGQFSPDGKRVLTASYNTTVKIWDAEKGILLVELKKTATDFFKSAGFSYDGKKILTACDDNTVKIWNSQNGELINTFFAVDSIDYFNLIPTGYYQCTPNASKLLHYVAKDLKVITFEQLDVKYNRPDKVLEAIGNTDTALIKSYRKAYEKRIKKLGIDTTAFRDGYSVPESDFINRDQIEYEQKTGALKFHIKGNDSTYKLDRFNVWVNETPVFGQRGINIRNRNKNDFDTTITLKLSQGENRIETSITNVNGTESYRMPLTVNYTAEVKQKETIRFIGIGIDQFANNQYNLQYSAKDIRDLSKKLKEKYKDDIIIDTLFNENVTINNVKELKQKLQQTTENDKVIIAYSGHGMLSKEYDYYLSTYSVNFDKPEQNGLPYDELENLLDSIPARKKLMLIDACHSGEVDKDDLVTLNAFSDSLIKGLKPVAYKKEGHLGLKNSFELMQSLFVNVGKSTGATIISAAAGTQFALERNDLKNGVFTYSILEAMNTYPTLKISELKKIVGERVEQLTNGLQKPTSRNETIAVDWNIW